jgi:hypothetical protein
MIGKRRQIGIRSLGLLFAALVLVSGCGPSRSPASPPPNGPPPPPRAIQVWETDPALSGQLGPYEVVGDFQMRWPNGFQHMRYDGPIAPGCTVLVRQGVPRSNGGRPRIIVMTTKVPPDQRDAALKRLFAAQLVAEKKWNPNGDWQETPQELGSINGISAIKGGWEASLSFAPGKTHGVVFACASPSGSLMLAAISDAEPYSEKTLKLLAASALSLRSDDVRVAISDHLTNWQPSATFLGDLDDYEELGDDYEIRWPKWFEESRDAANWAPDLNVYYRAGSAARSGVLRPLLLLCLQKLSPEAQNMPLEQLTDARLSKLKEAMRFRGDWQQTPIESGQINGLTFQRFAWQANNGAAPKSHGFVYAGRDGGVLLIFFSSGFEPNHEQALGTCNASLMTFRKKQKSEKE